MLCRSGNNLKYFPQLPVRNIFVKQVPHELRTDKACFLAAQWAVSLRHRTISAPVPPHAARSACDKYGLLARRRAARRCQQLAHPSDTGEHGIAKGVHAHVFGPQQLVGVIADRRVDEYLEVRQLRPIRLGRCTLVRRFRRIAG